MVRLFVLAPFGTRAPRTRSTPLGEAAGQMERGDALRIRNSDAENNGGVEQPL
jgi:hypothetical protein